MEKELCLFLYIAFGGGAAILFIFTLMAFINVKGLDIKEGKNIRGGMILLINTAIYGAIAYMLNLRIQRIKYEEEKNRNLDNFLELPSLNYNFNANQNQ